MAKTKIIPRGLRNNNPLNIRVGNVWLGEVSNPTDGVFEQFTSIEYGLRAGFVLIRRYIRHYKNNTIRLIVSRWAPSTENNTEAYIQRVSQASGIAPDNLLHYEDEEAMCKIVDAMVLVECGERVPMVTIHKGYKMA